MQLIAFGVIALVLSTGPSKVWQAPKDPAKQLDFWVGSWKCSGEMAGPNGQKTKTEAQNVISKEMGGHVIHEHFKMTGLNGTSLSVYNPRKKLWEQTWVDDSGSYLAFSGGVKDGKMALSTAPDAAGRIKRMVFSNITPKSFDWDWQGSKDGKTWKPLWHLHYTRVGK